MNRLIIPRVSHRRGHNGPVLEVRRSCHQSYDENLNGRGTHGYQARGVLFPLGAAASVTPEWIVLRGAVSTRHPSEQWKTTSVCCATNPRGVMIFPVPEELTLRWRRHHDSSAEMFRQERDALLMLAVNSGRLCSMRADFWSWSTARLSWKLFRP